MKRYENMKKSKNGMPTFDSFLEPILAIIPENETWNTRDLMTHVVESSDLPDEIKNMHYPGYEAPGDETIAENRVSFALSLLKNSGLITGIRRGLVKSNPDGENFLKENSRDITEKKVKSLPRYQEYEKMKKKRKKSNANLEEIKGDIIKDSPSENKISNIVNELNSSVANDLLQRILDSSPSFFEQITVDLLSSMGYKGVNGSAIATKRSGDGGIDGIISEDPLGTKMIYIQAKKYSNNNNVSRPEIQSFYGALSEAGNDKGVFITTSHFSRGALEAASKFGNIITIDGIKLTNLMVEYRVGINIKRKYELVDIDEDYFITE